MSFPDMMGSLGVALLLLAFLLNLLRYTSQASHLYLFLNIVGAALSCYASWLIRYIPFVVLEAAWCLVGLAALLKRGVNEGK
jgi:hypothetical protein